MGVYLFCVCVGFAGLLVMAMLGHGHLLGQSHGHSPTHVGHANAHTHAHAVSHARGHAKDGSSARASVLAWLSPRVFFSLLFAFGASGYLLQHLLPTTILFVVALVLAVAFERVLVQPLSRWLFGFASNPARTLDTALLEEAEAVTNFDHQGNGLVSLNLDGQVVQILGVLNQHDREHGVRIRAGDRVSITQVDTRRNRCTVARVPVTFSGQTA